MKRNMTKAIAVVLSMSMTMSFMTTSANVDAAKKIKLSKKSVTLAIGKSSTIKVKNIKAKKIKKLTVKSSNKKIAAVKRDGKKRNAFKVTGKAEGSAKILVKLHLRGQKKPKKLTLKVNVTQKRNVPDVKETASTQPGKTPGAEGNTSGASTVAPTAKAPAGPAVAPTAKATVGPTGVPVVTPGATGSASETMGPTASGAPAVKPTGVPVVTPGATGPAGETMKPIATMKPTVEPTAKPTATPVVSVPDTLQIESVMVTGNHKLSIFFNKPSGITADVLAIKTKKTEQDSYGEALRIKSIKKIDPLQYDVVLDDDTKTASENYIVNNGYVQVSVAGESGTPLVAENQFECESVTTTWQWIQQFTLGTGESLPLNLHNENFVGEIQCKVIGDMPDGIRCSLSKRDLYVVGTPNKAGIYKYDLSITDEAGNNLVCKCTSLVGDAKTLYAAATERYILVGKKDETYVEATGGSGSYTYTNAGGNCNFTVGSDGEVKVAAEEFKEAGTYQLYVDVADAANANLKTRVTVVYHVEGTCELRGSVRDLGGTGLYFRGGGLKIFVIPQDREIRYKYLSNKPRAKLAVLNSTFHMNVPAGIYDIQFENDYGSVYKVIKDVEVSGEDVKCSLKTLGTISLPVCQVNLEAPNKDNLYEIDWRDEEGVLIGEDETFPVRPGTYTIHSDPDTSKVMASLYDFKVSFTATNDTVRNVVVAATPTGDRITELTLENDMAVSLAGHLSKWYRFVPKETGKYQFYSTGLEKNMWFEIYSDKQYRNSDWHYLTFSIDTLAYKNGNQVNYPQTLDAGTTYYISLNLFWPDDKDDFVFGLETAESDTP